MSNQNKNKSNIELFIQKIMESINKKASKTNDITTDDILSILAKYKLKLSFSNNIPESTIVALNESIKNTLKNISATYKAKNITILEQEKSLIIKNGILNEKHFTLHLSLFIEKIENAVDALIDYLKKNKIEYELSLANTYQNGNLLIKINTPEDKDKIIDFIKNNEYFNKRQPIIPLIPSINNIGITVDTKKRTYNDILADIIKNIYTTCYCPFSRKLSIDIINSIIDNEIKNKEDGYIKSTYELINKLLNNNDNQNDLQEEMIRILNEKEQTFYNLLLRLSQSYTTKKEPTKKKKRKTNKLKSKIPLLLATLIMVLLSLIKFTNSDTKNKVELVDIEDKYSLTLTDDNGKQYDISNFDFNSIKAIVFKANTPNRKVKIVLVDDQGNTILGYIDKSHIGEKINTINTTSKDFKSILTTNEINSLKTQKGSSSETIQDLKPGQNIIATGFETSCDDNKTWIATLIYDSKTNRLLTGYIEKKETEIKQTASQNLHKAVVNTKRDNGINLNLRERPGINSNNILMELENGTTIYTTTENIKNKTLIDGHYWLKVELLDGTSGYVDYKYIDLQDKTLKAIIAAKNNIEEEIMHKYKYKYAYSDKVVGNNITPPNGLRKIRK